MSLSAPTRADEPVDVVAPELLTPPSGKAGRGLERDAWAERVHDALGRLARAEARCRLVLGRLARAFLRRKAHRDLGFARFGDWTRERLGLSARELQSLARVEERLARLPAVAAAFGAGAL